MLLFYGQHIIFTDQCYCTALFSKSNTLHEKQRGALGIIYNIAELFTCFLPDSVAVCMAPGCPKIIVLIGRPVRDFRPLSTIVTSPTASLASSPSLQCINTMKNKTEAIRHCCEPACLLLDCLFHVNHDL